MNSISLEERVNRLESIILEQDSTDNTAYRFRKVLAFNDSITLVSLDSYAYRASFGDVDYYYKKYKMTKSEMNDPGNGLNNLVKAVLGSASQNGEMPKPNSVARAINSSNIGYKTWKVSNKDPSSRSGKLDSNTIVLVYTDSSGNTSYIRCEGPMVKAK